MTTTPPNLRISTYQPDIAQNLGNMIRTAACFGVPISVIEPCGFPVSLKSLRRSAMDYADIAKIDRHDDWSAYLNAGLGRNVLLTTKTDIAYTDFEFLPGDCLVLGRESAGVPNDVHHACDKHITIPMPGGGRSLNVSTAMAIVLGEAVRQLTKQ